MARSRPPVTSGFAATGFTLLDFLLRNQFSMIGCRPPQQVDLARGRGAGVTSFLVMSSGKAQKPDRVRFGGLGPSESNISQAFSSDSQEACPLGSRDRDRLSASSSLLCFVPKKLAYVGCFNERLACWLPEDFSHGKHKEEKGKRGSTEIKVSVGFLSKWAHLSL